jgi:hypothetical protein
MKHPDERRHPQLYTAIIAIAAIARRLGLSPPPSLLRDGRVDRYAIAKLAIEIAKRDGGELRAAAAAAYRDQFGEPVAEITLNAAGTGAGTRP